MTVPKSKAIHYTDVPVQVFGAEAPGTTIRWVIDEPHDGAPHYALRVIEGQGRVLLNGQWHDVSPGSVIFVPAGTEHTYENTGETPFRFLCGIPTSRHMVLASCYRHTEKDP